MSLEPGTTLGPYHVTAKIGEGGMGEVYRARDTKLDRDVALKVLPQAFTDDPDRLARFEREAKVLASLNHPNIGHIYGLEEAEGQKALVLELVEGPTLAERIKQGPIPVDEALPIAKQIAEALEAAHEQGIIHRDLKPANVKVKDDGTVKVLDFGLAKAFQPDASSVSASMSPTISLTAAATQMGMVIGTAAYMAPEQAKGRPVDRRADIWAFGVLLYEMLSGQRPFTGEDVSDTLGAVLRLDADVSALPENVPATLRAVIIRCLQKDPKQRLRDIGDVRLAMDGAFETTSQVTLAHATASHQTGRRTSLSIAVGALVLGSLVTGGSTWYLTRPAAPPVVRFSVTRFADSGLRIGPGLPDVAVSPSGQHLAYVTGSGNQRQLHVRALDQPTSNVVAEGNLSHPFFSADSESVGFLEVGELRRVSVLGGPPSTICSLPAGLLGGASWALDGSIVFGVTDSDSGLWRVAAVGGEPQQLTTLDSEAGEIDHLWPEILPGGETAFFTIVRNPIQDSEIAVLSLASGERKVVARGTFPRYSPTGHLVYGLDGDLWAVGFDVDRSEVIGDPVPVQEGVVTKNAFGAVDFGISENGSLLYVPSEGMGLGSARTLVWVDREGREEPVEVPPRPYTYARLSPDGTMVALDTRGDENDIWTWNLVGGTLQRLTIDPGPNLGPVWTPDGSRIAFTAQTDGVEGIYWQAADGAGTPERLTEGQHFPTSFSPDGDQLLFIQPLTPPGDVGVATVGDPEAVELLLEGEYNESNAEFSPDGRWLAYQSTESGTSEIYVRPFPDVNASRRQVSTDGGTRPLWSRDGRELFYYLEPGTILAVPVEPGADFAPGRPEVVVQGDYAFPFNAGRHYDVSPDGSRFLLLSDVGAREGEEPVAARIDVVLNWDQELLERVPLN